MTDKAETVEEVTEEPVAMPANIREAICAVMADLHRLKKADHNKFSNYDFTSVDDFKDAVRPLMAKYGLFLHVMQDVFAFHEIASEGKKPSMCARFDFMITLKHISGEVEDPELMTVVLPFTGAQTSGAARSYVIKEWMKSRFLASSGDMQEEADLLDNSREGMRLSKADARKLYDDLTKELREVAGTKDHVAVADWWKSSRERLDALPKDWFLTIKNECGEIGRTLKAEADLDRMSNDELDEMALRNHPINGG